MGNGGATGPGVAGKPSGQSGLVAAGLRFWAGLQSQEKKELAKTRSHWNQERVQGLPGNLKPPKDVRLLMCMPKYANRPFIGAYGNSKDPSADL